MISKLYNFKKTQTDQKLVQKGQINAKIDRIDAEILLTQNSIDTTTVQRLGAISDFTILTMHKNTMKMHISKLEKEKNILNQPEFYLWSHKRFKHRDKVPAEFL